MQVSWPRPVSADACARVLKLALGDNWRSFVTDLAGVQGAQQEAGTAEEGVVGAEAAGEESLEGAMWATSPAEATLSAEAPVSRGASSSEAGQCLPRPPPPGPWARRDGHLLSLKLEAITMLYAGRSGTVARTCHTLTT